MDWTQVMEAILNGSPWGLLLGLLYIAWQMRKEYLKELQDKDDELEAARKELKEANTSKLSLALEASKHCEEVTVRAQEAISELHDKRAEDIILMQKEAISTMAVLNATLSGLIDAIRGSTN